MGSSGASAVDTAGAADELPAFVDENRLLLGPVLFGLVPDEIQNDEHAYREQIPGKLGNVEYRVFVFQRYIGLLVKGGGGAVDHPV